MTGTSRFPIVDFHAHYAGATWPAVAQGGSGPAASGWADTASRISGSEDLVPALDRTGIDTRVLGAPPGLIRATKGPLSGSIVRAVNEHLAEQVAAHPGRLFGLGTIDAFAENAAENVEHAILDLGLHGIVVDVATDDLGDQFLLDAPQALPALLTAAHLGIPVFAHPLSPTNLTGQLLRSAGPSGVGLARGTITTASMLALVGSEVLDQLPGLHIVFPWLGGAQALLQLAGSQAASRMEPNAPPGERWHVYVDIMGLDPGWIRYAAGRLGADHVVMGSDWPIRAQYVTRAQVETALVASGLGNDEQRLIAGANALRLLDRSGSPDASSLEVSSSLGVGSSS